MKKINKLPLLILLSFAAVGSLFPTIIRSDVARADAVSDYCDKVNPPPQSGGTENVINHYNDLKKACVQGYNNGSCDSFTATANTSAEAQKSMCEGAKTEAKEAGSPASGCTVLPASVCDAKGGDGIWAIILFVLNIMTAGVGIAAVGGFVFASILYTTSGDTPERAKKAKDMMQNIVIGIIVFGLMYALLQFLIPGGVFQ